MALSFTNYESVLQAKLNAVTSSTTPQDLLLISKSVQSTVGNLVVTDIQSTGTTQIGLVQAAGTAQISAVNSAGNTKLTDLQNYYNSVVLGAPAALDTLDELAAALGDDSNFASTVTTALNARVQKSTFTTKGDIIKTICSNWAKNHRLRKLVRTRIRNSYKRRSRINAIHGTGDRHRKTHH